MRLADLTLPRTRRGDLIRIFGSGIPATLIRKVRREAPKASTVEAWEGPAGRGVRVAWATGAIVLFAKCGPEGQGIAGWNFVRLLDLDGTVIAEVRRRGGKGLLE